MRAEEDHRGGGRGRRDDEYGSGAGCCSCLLFCGLWGSRTRQRRRRFRLRFIRLSWFSWPWRKNSSKKKKKKTTTTTTKEAKGMKKRMLLLLSSSSSSSSPSPAKKTLAASVSAAAAGSLLLPKVSSFADGGKKQRKSGSKSLPRQTVGGGGGDDAAAPAKETAPPAWQPSPRPAGEVPGVKRALSRRHGSFRREPGGGGGLWTMATTLGVIVFFGRVTAVAFLCSCLYAARFVRAQAAGAAAAAANGKRDGGRSGRFGEPAADERPAAVVEVEVCTEEHKKKVVMEGLLDRGGKRLSSRFL